MGIYRPLVVTALLEGCHLPECGPPSSMRMNLMASSREDPRVFYIVNGDKILVYQFSTLTPSGLPTFIRRISDPRCMVDDTNDKTVNVIKVGYLGSDEVLVTADEAGDVCVWFTRNLQRDPLLLSVTESAWGIAIHSEQRLIAVSSNAHTATVFHCGIDSQLSQRLLSGDNDSSVLGSHPLSHTSASASSTPSSSTAGIPETGSSGLQTLVDQTSQQILRGHDHNIPCVAFSPCGNFVATASVDRTCRTWRLSDGKQIQQKSLGPLWGWGVNFVDQESWMTISRAEYRQIPKDHLRPGKLPGQNVRDSPLSTTAFSQRRLPPGRDFRMIRSRWFAGPLHNTSCDEQETDEEDDESRKRALAARGGEAMEDNDDMDDRDAALFGMDDDEGEDEWEDMSSSDADEEDMNDEEEEVDGRAMSRRRSEEVSSPLQDAEVSADTGDDGDNEGTGVDTEDGGGTTTEDGAAARSTFARNLKNERRMSVATVTRSRPLRGESSSEQEQRAATSSRSAETESVPVSEAENTLSDQGHQHCQQQQEDIDEQGMNQDPSLFVNMVSEEESFDRKRLHGPTGQHSTGVLSLSTQPRLPPQYPSELLLCATSRNIYLLSRHPAPPEEPKASKEGATNRETSSSESVEGPQEDTPFWMTLSHAIEDEDEDDQLLSLIGLAHEEMLGWPHEEGGVESEYDPDYDTDPYYEDMDEFMGTADEDSDDDDDEEGHSDEDDDDEDVDMDGFSTYHGRPQRPNVDDDNGDSNSIRKPAVPMLHTISVARAAAARADGRRFHHLEHFDRLFVMLLVPELSVLVAASQKGSVTIFRLLRVLDDAPLPLTMAQSSSSSLSNSRSKESAEVTATSRKRRTRDTESSEKVMSGVEKDKEKTTQRPTITIQGAKYVLFPEVYLPRLEPPPFPLFGVSIVPLQRSNHSGRSSSYSNNSDNPDYPSSPSLSASSPVLPPSSACSSSSYMLHLAYIDSQFYSYEIRLRNEKDDPVGLSNVFV